jgi:hypothetical protein
VTLYQQVWQVVGRNASVFNALLAVALALRVFACLTAFPA